MNCSLTLIAIGFASLAAGAQALDRAYEEAVEQTLPLSPGEIRDFRNRADEVARAAAALPKGNAPHIVTSSASVDIAPGAAIPMLATFPELQSHLVFLDTTGQPWPIERWSTSGTEGNPQRFKVSQDGVNILTVSSGMHYAYGNLGVKLQGLDTMVVVNLVQSTQAKTVDARRELHIQRRGPLAKPVAGEADAIPGFNAVLYDFLDGLPPAEAEELAVRGDPSARAWRYKDQLIFRSQCALLSPAWEASTQAADGTRLYALAPTPTLLVSVEGKMTHVRVGD